MSASYCFAFEFDILHENEKKKKKNEPQHDKTNKMTCTCTPSEDSDQPGHPRRFIRVFAKGNLLGLKVSCGQRRLIRLDGCAD